MAGQNVGRACGAGRRLAQPCLVLGIASLCSVLYTGSRTLTRLGYSLAQFDNPLPVGPYATLAGGFTGIAIGIRSWLFPVTTAGRLQVTFDIHSAYRIIAAAVGKRRSPVFRRPPPFEFRQQKITSFLGGPIRCYWLVIAYDQLHSNCATLMQRFLTPGIRPCRTTLARETSVGRSVTCRNMSATIRDGGGGHGLLRVPHATRFRCILHRSMREWQKH